MTAEAPRSRRRVKVAEAAEHLGLSKSHLNKLRLPENAHRGPPFYKVGKAIIYDLTELDAWLAARRCTSTTDGGVR
jgi:predicted DNA-binding transcriptional regulator AlpA